MQCTPQKSKVAAARTTQVAQKLEKRQTSRKTFPFFSHSFPSRVLWREMKGISEKRVGKTTGKEPG